LIYIYHSTLLIFRYPSGKSKVCDNNERTQILESNEKDIKNLSETSLNDNVDYVKLNKERISVASKLASQLHSGEHAPPQNYRVGVVPK
jgi:hypothetical protein